MASNNRLLQVMCWGTAGFGAAMLLAPGLTRQGFSLLIFGQAGAIDAWPDPARHYATLLHGVLGAVMVGWAVALLMALRPEPEPGSIPTAQGWRVVAASVACWYGLDSAFSLSMGAWQNAVLNTVFAAGFATALALARGPAQAKPA